MCKVVKVFSQTFVSKNSVGFTQDFEFKRIMKLKPKQYFRIKVSSINSDTNFGLFMSDFADINSLCSTVIIDGNNENTNNRFYLGSLTNPSITELLIEEIPLNKFTIFSEVTDVDYIVSFQIELIEM